MQALLSLVLLASCGGSGDGAAIELAGTYASGFDAGTEIVSVQASTRRAVVAIGPERCVDLLDLSSPAEPKRVARHPLDLADGEQLTSVAFHPTGDWYLAAIQAAGPTDPGRVELRSAATGELLARAATGVGPDCVYVDPTGRFAATADEGEPFTFDPGARTFSSPVGGITLVNLALAPRSIDATSIPIPDASDVSGFTTPRQHRFLERAVDWNGNGTIDDEVDFDGDGKIGKGEVVVGTFEGVDVRAKETDGEVFLIPITSGSPELLEPEVVAFTPDGDWAFVTLQENNGIWAYPIHTDEPARLFGLGVTRHMADVHDNGRVRMNELLTALREPDGLAFTPDGALLVTADEGDTEPRASEVEKGGTAGGGRTVSVFEPRTGRLLGDTGQQLDEAAARAGVYDDDRSDNKGSEPEMIVAFELGGTSYAAVGLERAEAVALVSLADPAHPEVVGLAPIDPRHPKAAHGPEGLAYLKDEEAGVVWVFSANEISGTVSVFRCTARP